MGILLAKGSGMTAHTGELDLDGNSCTDWSYTFWLSYSGVFARNEEFEFLFFSFGSSIGHG